MRLTGDNVLEKKVKQSSSATHHSGTWGRGGIAHTQSWPWH
jgi:hypothetical protein